MVYNVWILLAFFPPGVEENYTRQEYSSTFQCVFGLALKIRIFKVNHL